MRAAVCDDTKQAMDLIYTTVCSEFEKQGFLVQTAAFSDSKALLEIQKKNPYDILFLDVCMPDVSGFQLAEEIRSKSDNAFIVFVTEKEELVYESFDYQPFYFIRKDCTENIKCNISKAISRLSGYIKQNGFMLIDRDSVKVPVKYGNIMYIKSDKHYLEYHMADKSVMRIRGSLNIKEQELQDYDFAKIHQRYLVNLKYIKYMDKSKEIIILKNGERLGISRSNKSFAEEKYTRYLSKNL